MLFPRCALLNPAADRFNLFGRQCFVGGLRRHAAPRHRCRDSLIHQALLGLARRDRRASLSLSEHALLGVEAEIHHARIFVGSVALKAIVGKQRPDLTLKVDRLGLLRQGNGPENQ